MTSDTSPRPASPLRARMIEDMEGSIGYSVPGDQPCEA